jgi:hypothetical protein
MSRIRRTTHVPAVAALVLVLSSAIAGTAFAVAADGSGATPSTSVAPARSTVSALAPDTWFPDSAGTDVTAVTWFPNSVGTDTTPADTWFPSPGMDAAAATWFPGPESVLVNATPALSQDTWFPLPTVISA